MPKADDTNLEYQQLVEQATDGVFISDAAGNYLDVNRAAIDMLGYSKAELLKMNVREILIKEEVELNPPRFDELKTGRNILSKRRVRKKDGTVLHVEINAKMLSSGNMLGMVRDITDRVIAEEKLGASEEKFRKLTETAFDAIILTDESGTISFWNRGAEIIFGYSVHEAVGQSLTMIMPERYRAAHGAGM